MSTGTFPVAPELQLMPRALKRAVNPPMTPEAAGLNDAGVGGRVTQSSRVREGLVRVQAQPALSPVGDADTTEGPI